MTEAKLKARLVRINVDQGETGLLYATSPDLKGLLVAERTPEALDASIPSAISDLYAACGESVVVIPFEEHGSDQKSWLKVPADIAKSALAAMAERHTH